MSSRLYIDRLYRLAAASLDQDDEFVDLMLDQLDERDCDALNEALSYLVLRVSGRRAQMRGENKEGEYQY